MPQENPEAYICFTFFDAFVKEKSFDDSFKADAFTKYGHF